MSKVSARQKVKAARARVDAERRARESRVDEAAEQYHQQSESIERADQRLAKAQSAHEEALTQARASQDAAVAAMVDEGESIGAVAELLSLTKGEVTSAKRRHQAATREGNPSSPAPEASGVGASDEVGAA